MLPTSFKRHRFPPDVIRHAVWLYFRFTLSLGDVEEMLAERGIDASYEAIRGWTLKFEKNVRAQTSNDKSEVNRPLALGRNGCEDRRQENAVVARRR